MGIDLANTDGSQFRTSLPLVRPPPSGYLYLLPIPPPKDRSRPVPGDRNWRDGPIGSQNFLLAKVPDPWPAVRDPGGLKRGSRGLESLSGVRVRGPGPMGRGARCGAMVSMAGSIQSKCLAMKKAAMNAAIILNKEKG